MNRSLCTCLNLLSLLTAFALTGCAENPGQITPGQKSLTAGEDSAAYLDRMSSLETVGEDDAFRGLLLLTDGDDTTKNFAGRVERLQDKNILPADWDFTADRPITHGKLAYMLYQATNMPGGVMLAVTGPNQRYCHREMLYRKVMVQTPVYTPVTGLEFVAILTRADTYKRTGRVPDAAGRTDPALLP